MGLDGEGGSGASKVRKRQLVLESSDSEADGYYISTRQKADAPTPAAGNAGSGSRGAGDQSREKAAPVSSENFSGAMSAERDGPEKNKGDEPNRSSSQPDTKRTRVEDAHGGGAGNGGSVSKVGNGGKRLPPGFPTWRFEKPEVRAGRVLNGKGGVETKASSGSKVKEHVSCPDNRKRRMEPLKHEKHTLSKTDMGGSVGSGRQAGGEEMKARGESKVKEQVSSPDDKRKRFEPLKHEKRTPLKTDKGGSVHSGQHEGGEEMNASSGSKFKEQVSGLDDNRRLPDPLKHEKRMQLKTDKGSSVVSGQPESGEETKAALVSKAKEQVSGLDDKRRRVEPPKHDNNTLLKTNKGNSVDSSQRDVIRVQGKSGLLKVIPKNNKTVRETEDGKILRKKSEVDGETGDSKIVPKNTKVEGTSERDCKIVTKSGVLKLLPKNNKVIRECSDGKLLPENIKVDRETENGRILTKNTAVDGESSEGKILTKNSKINRNTGDDKVLTKNCMMDCGKTPVSKNKAGGETNYGDIRDKEKSSAVNVSRRQDADYEKRITGKLVSSIDLRRSDPSVVGVSLGQSMKQQNSRAQANISSQGHHQPSPSITQLGVHKNKKKRLLEHKASPENVPKKAKSKVTNLQDTSGSLKKHGMKKPRGGPRNEMKRKLRDQIKDILLKNGWKIDLRLRKNKDYEDSVYVSPQGNGYWSITKAYAVFQEQSKNPDDENHTSPLSNPNNLEARVEDDSCHAISKNDLAMLQRIVRKRRGRKEHSVEKKCGENRRKNLKGTSAGRSSRSKHHNNDERVKIKHRGCALLVRGSTSNIEGMYDYIPYQWKRTVLSWLIDMGVVPEDSKVKYTNKKGANARLEGRITREGIYCGCCSKILTVSKFELHAGSKEQQPYAKIVLEDGGVSLLQCLLDAWDKQAQQEKKGFYKIDPAEDPDDDTCGICGDGGDLLCCDHCTSTFHVACLGIKMPSGDWYCRSCICRFCGSGEESTAFSAELLSCLQCSRKYHQVCAPGPQRDPVCTKPSTSIDCCSPGCRKIYKRLKKLVGLKNDMEAGFSWRLVRCFSDIEAAPRKTKAQLVHCNSKSALAFSVMDECFLPRVDERSGINIIHNVVYNCGSDFHRLNFSGFHTFILERGDEVISAATVRIHGTDLAEMPFIGTRDMYRRQGMCHRLLSAIESVLRCLNVRRLVIPAIPELQNTWTTVFGFKPVGPTSKQKIKSLNLLIIHGTGLLEKRLLLKVNAVGRNNEDAQTVGAASGSLTPVHASREFAVGGDPEIRDHEISGALTESSAGLPSELPPVPKEKAPERTSPSLVDSLNMRTAPGVSGDDMLCKSETDNIEEVQYAETNRTFIAEEIVAKQNSEDEPNGNDADSSSIPVTLDPCSSLSNELGKCENCPSSEVSVEDVLAREKTEFSLSVVSVDTKVPLVTMDRKSDNQELKATDADTQGSLEAKGLEQVTVIVNGRSLDICTPKDQTFVSGATNNTVATTEDRSQPAGDLAVSIEGPVQKKDDFVKDKTGSPFVDLKVSSGSKIERDTVEMKDATKAGITLENSNEAVPSVSALDMSNDICGEVIAKTLTCGEGQLHGDDGLYSNNMEDGLASR